MAVSGSKNFTVTRDQIIESALRKIGVLDQFETADSNDVGAATRALNLIVKEFTTEGLDMFMRVEQTLFLQPGQQSYVFNSSNVHIADSYVETTLSAAEASGQTVISVTSSTGMTASDNVGIKMDDDTIHWTTISSVDSSTQITIASATDDDAASGNKVYAYTNKSTDRIAKLFYAYRSDKNGIDTEVSIVGETEYRRLSNKTSDGPVNQIFYNPQGQRHQENAAAQQGTLYVWPDDGGADLDKLILIGNTYPDDFDAATNNPDFPVEWVNCLVWTLAAELASEYGVPEQEQGRLWTIANQKLDRVLAHDVEDASVRFVMDYER
jgi:hypothetical protein